MSVTKALSKAALARFDAAMVSAVECGQVPGVITMIRRGDEAHVNFHGFADLQGRPLARDAIFRITSMSKPVVAAAALVLVEEGVLQLDAPISSHLPELAERQVLTRFDAPLTSTVPAKRAITLRHLLTGVMGFGSMVRPPGVAPIQQAERTLRLMTLSPPKPATPYAATEWIQRFASLPLMHQPGEEWTYNTSSTVLSVLIERAAGRRLSVFLKDRLFDPLGMRDTGFWVPPHKLHRLVACYQLNAETDVLELHDGVQTSQWSTPPALEDGAGGLVSTIDDYDAFAQMILNGGMFAGHRILLSSSIEAMTTNQLSPSVKRIAAEFLGPSRGWGFGLSVLTHADEISARPGRFGWDGGYGTSWYADPQYGLSAILFTQRLVFPVSSGIDNDFWKGVYRVIES